MSTFQRCHETVNDLASEILCEFETHKPLLDARVTVDFVFAFADIDEQTQQPVGNALSKNGVKALGKSRHANQALCSVRLRQWKEIQILL